MVVGGYTSYEQIISNVEVLSLEMSNYSVPECMQSLNEFPSTLALASGGLSPGFDIRNHRLQWFMFPKRLSLHICRWATFCVWRIL